MNPQSNPGSNALNGSNMYLPIKNGIRVGSWVDEIAFKEIFRLSDSTIDNYRRKGILPCSKWGGKLFFDINAILRLLEQNRH